MKDAVYTKGTCAKLIIVDEERGVIKSVEFKGGCQGALTALAKLIEGKTLKEAADLLEDIQCGERGTSCPDQLAKYLRKRGGSDAPKG
jgi:uncharacterized protein (TIGR03905 family)